MPIESGTTIANLDKNWPLGSDDVFEGDDHLRLVKSVLKSQFPGSAGQGFNIPIDATENEINYLQGLTGNIQDQIDLIIIDHNLVAPPGTKIVFKLAVPPLGWSQDISDHNSMMRLVGDTTGGFFGGTDDPINLTVNLNHDHLLTTVQGVASGSGTAFATGSLTGEKVQEVDWHPRYVNLIVGVKD